MSGNRCQLRIAGPADAGGVTSVLASAYGRLLVPHYDPAVLAAALPRIAAANPRLLASGTYFVQETADAQATAGGRIVACGGWTHEAPGTGKVEPGIAHVRHFGTHADWTKQGLGAAIFERCRREALAAQVHTIICFATLGAEGFYRSLGFRVVECVVLTMGGGVQFPSVTMIWKKV